MTHPSTFPLRWLSFMLTCLTVIHLCGCSLFSQNKSALDTAILTANLSAIVVESSQGTAVAIYRAEQLEALDFARDNNETRDQAKARIVDIRQRWAPVWVAFSRARTAHTALTDAVRLYQAGSGPESSVEDALASFKTATENALQLLNHRNPSPSPSSSPKDPSP
jgi:hypothetical protein